jgi:uroporphyrinogen decarboxylase
MTARERIAMVLSHRIPDRVPVHDTYWEATVHRWRGEGLPADVSAEAFFQTEIVRIGGDYTMQFPIRTVEETDRYRLYWDSNGGLRKDLLTLDGWTPQWLDFTIKTPDDWRLYRHQMAFNDRRISPAAMDAYRQARRQDKFVVYSGHACFHPTWAKIGMERELTGLIEHPEFITELFAAHTRLMIDLYEGMRHRGMTFDAAWFNDDLGWTVAPLISPQMYRELVFPHHKRLCDYFSEQGLKTMLHSDGNVAPLIPHFLDAGFIALHPLEAKAGLDVRDLKRQYGPRLVLFGNVDVRKLSGTKEDIEEEIRVKLTAGKEGGGYIYHSDHSVPSSVSFANYCFALDMVRHYGRYT